MDKDAKEIQGNWHFIPTFIPFHFIPSYQAYSKSPIANDEAALR